MQGVSLFIGVKKTKKTDWAKVYYTDIWGTREAKFEALAKGNLVFSQLKLDQKMAYFIPFGSNDKEAYDKGVSVAELFPVNVTGIVSGNDGASIAPTKAELIRRMDIVKNATEEKDIFDLWGRFSRGQTAEKIQNDASIWSSFLFVGTTVKIHNINFIKGSQKATTHTSKGRII